MASASLMYKAGHPNSVLWENTEGQDVEGGGFRMKGEQVYL